MNCLDLFITNMEFREDELHKVDSLKVLSQYNPLAALGEHLHLMMSAVSGNF